MKIEDQRDIRRRKQDLDYAEKIGSVTKSCRYFGLPRSTFYRRKTALIKQGGAGLIKRKPIPKSHPRTTPDQVVEKIIHLRRKYHLVVNLHPKLTCLR
jgi:hypothetical protein